MTAAFIAVFLSIIFDFSLLWTRHEAVNERFQFTREPLRPLVALRGLHLAGKTYKAIKGDPQFRAYAFFSWLVHRGGFLCMWVAIGGLLPLLWGLWSP